MKQPAQAAGINILGEVPRLLPGSWIEPPAVIHATLAPNNLIQVGAFTGIYGGRLGHCSIGRYCSIAPGVDIASDQHPMDWLSSSMIQYVPNLHGWGRWLESHDQVYNSPTHGFNSNSRVEIGNDVWIGQGVFVKSGVKIGSGAVVAAHSVVISDVPPYAIVAGVPAKVRRYRFGEEMIARLLEFQWWKYNVSAVKNMNFSAVDGALDQLKAAIDNEELTPYAPEKFNLNQE